MKFTRLVSSLSLQLEAKEHKKFVSQFNNTHSKPTCHACWMFSLDAQCDCHPALPAGWDLYHPQVGLGMWVDLQISVCTTEPQLSCCGQTVSPGEKSNQRLRHGQEGLQQEEAEWKRECGKWGEICLKCDLFKDTSACLSVMITWMELADWNHNSASLSFWIKHLLWSTWAKPRRGKKLIQTLIQSLILRHARFGVNSLPWWSRPKSNAWSPSLHLHASAHMSRVIWPVIRSHWSRCMKAHWTLTPGLAPQTSAAFLCCLVQRHLMKR